MDVTIQALSKIDQAEEKICMENFLSLEQSARKIRKHAKSFPCICAYAQYSACQAQCNLFQLPRFEKYLPGGHFGLSKVKDLLFYCVYSVCLRFKSFSVSFLQIAFTRWQPAVMAITL